MKLIVITRPRFFEGEAAIITALFENGLEILHLRKPEASAGELDCFLQQLPDEYMSRIVTHEHFQMVSVFNLKGIHLNGRNKHAPTGYSGHISCSCHSFDEVSQRKRLCDYVFLSPVYDSISKEGYTSAYPYDSLLKACQAGIIDEKVIALGGVGIQHLPEIHSLGFGGVAVLGDVWKRKEEDILPHFIRLQASCAPV
ncbi:thiamine phosphate synthase [Bacteroides heparinolyticus]|uniref:Thiamine phosphate synthase n=3 Tax=Prevotella heparinolytica TaxID=28113 RepID=A0A3P2A2Z8_9BACE|nr:thiamine phosphate synthase [Bacteroides heparinolyticus]RRD88630.1 thiamine phosphate synthase [Bacteroides heparinolyticus]